MRQIEVYGEVYGEVYVTNYEKATVTRRSGKRRWYACCTIPPELREFFNGRRQEYLSLGTEDQREAFEKLKDAEEEIWRRFDKARGTSHPLAEAAYQLDWVLGLEGGEFSHHFNFDRDEVRQGWLDPAKRKEQEEDLRFRASQVLNDYGFPDREQVRIMEQVHAEVRPVYERFLNELAKVEAEERTPAAKSSMLFSDVVAEYVASPRFLRSLKTNELKRQRTLDKQRNGINTFMRWAGPIKLDSFTNGLATNFAEALADPSNKLVQHSKGSGISKETLAGYFQSVRNVLSYAVSKDYLPINPWLQVDIRGIGEAPKKYRDWTSAERKSFFSLKMPPQDRLLAAILACTGCRLDEAALLNWSQLGTINEDGIDYHYFDVRDAVVKNANSRRLIPIVPDLWRLVERHHTKPNAKDPQRLFTYSKDKDGKAERKASEALMRHVRKVSRDETFALHGLRHTFASLCRNASIDWEQREFIAGRGGKGEGANYGEPAEVPVNVKALCVIDWSFLNGGG
jgi:integrase